MTLFIHIGQTIQQFKRFSRSTHSNWCTLLSQCVGSGFRKHVPQSIPLREGEDPHSFLPEIHCAFNIAREQTNSSERSFIRQENLTSLRLFTYISRTFVEITKKGENPNINSHSIIQGFRDFQIQNTGNMRNPSPPTNLLTWGKQWGHPRLQLLLL